MHEDNHCPVLYSIFVFRIRIFRIFVFYVCTDIGHNCFFFKPRSINNSLTAYVKQKCNHVSATSHKHAKNCVRATQTAQRLAKYVKIVAQLSQKCLLLFHCAIAQYVKLFALCKHELYQTSYDTLQLGLLQNNGH